MQHQPPTGLTTDPAAADKATELPIGPAATGARDDARGTRDSLIKATIEIFRAQGYEGTRVKEVAKRCGLTTGAVYSNFGSKDELLAEAMWDASGRSLDEPLYEGIGAPDSASERLRMVVGNILQAKNRDLHVEAIVATRRSSHFAQVFLDQGKKRRGKLRALIQRGIDEGEFDKDLDLDTAAHLILSILSGVALLGVLPYVEALNEDAWKSMINKLIDSWRPNSTPESRSRNGNNRYDEK